MAYEFRIVSYGIPVVLRHLEEQRAAASDLKPALVKIMDYVFEVEKELFDAEGARGGPKWVALSYRWLQKKAKDGHDTRILRMTGQLYASLTEWRHPLQYLRIEGKTGTIVFKSNRPYAGVHFEGLPPNTGLVPAGIGEVKIPRRRFIRFTTEDRDDMATFIRNHMLAGWAS